jgi:heterodisulfide reductase subunit D
VAGKEKISFVEGLSKLQRVELDSCSRCSECLKWCPVYEALQIKEITTPEKITAYRQFHYNLSGLKSLFLGGKEPTKEELENFRDALYQCTTCGACGESCEVGIWTQKLWPTLRKKMVELGIGPPEPQRTIEGVIKVKHNPYDLPSENRFSWLPKEVTVLEEAEWGYYAGCSGSYVAQPMVAGAVKFLSAAGIPFTMLNQSGREEWCCGFPLYIIGQQDLVKELIEHNLNGYVQQGVKKLIVSCPCCTYMIRNMWPQFYGQELPFTVHHISEIAAPILENQQLSFQGAFRELVTYHDPCYLSRGVRIVQEPRQVLQEVPGLKLVEMERNHHLSHCCGAGGGIRRAYPELSYDIAINTIKKAEATGAKVMAISCPACYERLHLAIKVCNYHTELKIMDLMDIVTQAITPSAG